MSLQKILRIGLAGAIVATAAMHLLLVLVLKVKGVDVNFSRSIKPGIIEGLYKTQVEKKSLRMGLLIRLYGILKILTVLAAGVDHRKAPDMILMKQMRM